MFTQIFPLSIYIHLPWCVKKCPYCDFNAHPLKRQLPEAEYVAALITDLERDLPLIWGRRPKSLFFGGGTPSLFSGAALSELLSAFQSRLCFGPEIEITLEANPGTVEQMDVIKAYRQAGVNRLSLGAQSFQDQQLKRLGRIHTSKEIDTSIEILKAAGFDNFNIDVMFGLPQQTVDDALEDLKRALAHEPTHFSWYQLTLEPNTLFHHSPPELPHEEVIDQMQIEGRKLLKEHRYEQYEVSAYAKKGYPCQHHLNYWTFSDYLGIGAGAHGKITDFSAQQVLRTSKIKHPAAYLTSGETNRKICSASELIFEFMLNALRLYRPISFEAFEIRTGLLRSSLMKPLQCAADKGLLTYHQDALEVTELGRRFLNDLTTLFL